LRLSEETYYEAGELFYEFKMIKNGDKDKDMFDVKFVILY